MTPPDPTPSPADVAAASSLVGVAAVRALADAGEPVPSVLIPAPAAPTNAVERKALLAAPPVEGLETFDLSDVRLPILKLRQPQTPGAEAAPDGSWFLSADPDAHSLLRDVVILSLAKERSLLLPYGGGLSADALVARIERKTHVQVPTDWQGPVCFSRDRVTPVAQEGLEPLAKDCASCPMGRWRTEHGRRSQDCAESYRVLVFDRSGNRPAFYFARGSAIKPFQELLNTLQVECRRLDRPSFAFSSFWSTKRVDSDDGLHYHVPVFSRPFPIEDLGEVAFFASVARCYRGVVGEEE